MTQEPTFLFGVGATKAGTTWLWRFLADHPECHFRTIKELHYFDCLADDRFEAALRKAREDLDQLTLQMIAGDKPGNADIDRMAADLVDWIKVLQRRAADPAAYSAYLLDGRGDRRVVGEVTPAYALLPVDRLRTMATIGGDARFIYLMRDPVARLWSHVRMLARRFAADGDYATSALALIRRICAGETSGEADGVVARGDYAGALARLDAAVDPARLLVMFQEDLMTVSGVARLCGFLGIGTRAANVRHLAHPGIPLPLPEAERRAARAFLRPQYDYIANRFEVLPAPWRDSMAGAAA